MNALLDRVAVLLVALAAMLWGTDALFRAPLIEHLSKDRLVASVQLVFAEHVVLALVVLPLLWLGRREIRRLKRRQWTAIALIGVGASALATVFFTQSFTYGHFIETLLLQKTQPLIALVLARLWLGERLPPRTYLWFPVALAGAYLIAIPDPLHPERAWADFHVAAAVFALGAAALWGAGTVFGRYALAGVSFPTLTALRFTIALPALGVALWLIAGAQAFTQYRSSDLPLYLGIALLPGLVAMLLYYRGLASTPASMATLAELAFPITGVIVNLYFVSPPRTITPWQIAGIAVLWLAIAALDLENARRPARVGPPEGTRAGGAEVATT
ncbi:MAG: DMT family transporter [Chloroflexota bacterium]